MENLKVFCEVEERSKSPERNEITEIFEKNHVPPSFQRKFFSIFQQENSKEAK